MFFQIFILVLLLPYQNSGYTTCRTIKKLHTLMMCNNGKGINYYLIYTNYTFKNLVINSIIRNCYNFIKNLLPIIIFV